MLSLGNLGALMAATPLVLVAEALGWRKCFVVFSIFVTFSTFLIILTAKDYPPEKERDRSKSNNKKISKFVFHSLALVSSNKDFWFIAISCFFRFGVLISIQGFLGILYLTDLGYNLQESGNILSMISFGYIIGSPLVGRLSDVVFRSRKKVVLVALFFFAVSNLPFLLKETKSQILWYIVFFGLGFFGSAGSVNFAHVKELFPHEVTGLALTGINLFSIGGIGVGQHFIGMIIGRFPKGNFGYPVEAYQQAFLILFLASIIAFIFYLLPKDTNPLHQKFD
jgi:sugar phosphate permease